MEKTFYNGIIPAVTFSAHAADHAVAIYFSLSGIRVVIAEELTISDKTVKCHVNSIFRKLRVTTRLQAILYAINEGVSDD